MEPFGTQQGIGDYIVIAAPPGNQVAESIAQELRAIGWTVIVTANMAPHANMARACIVLVSPETLNGPAMLSASNSNPRYLIPVLTVPLPLPYGPWSTAPIVLSASMTQSAHAVATAILNLSAVPPFPHVPPGYYPASSPSVPLYPPSGYQPPVFPSPVSYTPSRSLRPLWVGLSIVCILALVVTGTFLLIRRSQSPSTSVLTPQPSPTLVPTPQPSSIPAGFKVFVDSGGNYQLIIPQDWGASSGAGASIFIDPSRSADFAIAGPNPQMSAQDIASNEAAFFHSASTSGGGSGTYSVVDGATQMLAGETWTWEMADVNVSRGTLRAVVMIANHGNSSYLLGYAAVEPSYSEFSSQDFQPMVQSFRFLK